MHVLSHATFTTISLYATSAAMSEESLKLGQSSDRESFRWGDGSDFSEDYFGDGRNLTDSRQ